MNYDSKAVLAALLYDNRDIFVMKENPKLGFTHLLQLKKKKVKKKVQTKCGPKSPKTLKIRPTDTPRRSAM